MVFVHTKIYKLNLLSYFGNYFIMKELRSNLYCKHSSASDVTIVLNFILQNIKIKDISKQYEENPKEYSNI
jgi:hypothetical protein